MKTIFKSYGMKSADEIAELEKEAKKYLDETASSQTIYEHIMNDETFEYETEQDNLDKELDGNILCIASIGRWNGRFQGYKICGNNLKEVLGSFGCDEIHVFFDGFNIKSKGYHHDGTNYVEYREIRQDKDIDRLTNMIYSGKKITRSIINYYTKSLGSYIKEIYGW